MNWFLVSLVMHIVLSLYLAGCLGFEVNQNHAEARVGPVLMAFGWSLAMIGVLARMGHVI